MQAHGCTEPSEEIRLLLLQLLSLIQDLAGSAVAAYASEVWSMLSSGLADSYHEAAVQGCKAVQQFAGAVVCLPVTLTTCIHRITCSCFKRRSAAATDWTIGHCKSTTAVLI